MTATTRLHTARLAPFAPLAILALLAAACAAPGDDEGAGEVSADVSTAGIEIAAANPPWGGTGPILQCVPPWSPIAPGPGDVDTGFGCNGTASYSIPDVEVQVRALAVTTGDAIIAVGETYDLAMNNHDVWVARFTAAGKLDSTFATGGVFRHDFTAPLGGAESVESVVVQPSGAIVLGGGYWREDNSARKGFLMRLDASGAIDETFGVGGVVDTAAMTYVQALRLQANGTLVAVGEACSGGSATCAAAIGRFGGASGTPEVGFGTGGVVTNLLGGVAPARAYGAAVVGNTVLLGGRTKGPTTGSDVGLARFTSALDPTFGTAGTKTFDAAATETVNAIAPSGTKYVMAEAEIGSDGAERFVLRRILGTGAADPAFGIGGRAIDGFSGNGSAAYDLVVTGTKIVAVGSARDSQQRNRIAVARFTSSGVLDSTFSDDGNVMLSAGGNEAVGQAVVVQSTGRIVVGGWAAPSGGKKRAALVRILP